MREHIHRIAKHVAVSAVAIAGLTITSGITIADAMERAELVRLIHELEQLETLIHTAETAAVSTRRVRFQYLWLRADLEKIKAGIREYLDVAPTTPRTPPPLAGDYIR